VLNSFKKLIRSNYC